MDRRLSKRLLLIDPGLINICIPYSHGDDVLLNIIVIRAVLAWPNAEFANGHF